MCAFAVAAQLVEFPLREVAAEHRRVEIPERRVCFETLETDVLIEAACSRGPADRLRKQCGSAVNGDTRTDGIAWSPQNASDRSFEVEDVVAMEQRHGFNRTTVTRVVGPGNGSIER